MMWRGLTVTGALVAGGLILLLLVAIPLGTLAASRPRSWLDRLSVTLSVAAISTHPLVVGLLLQLFVGNRWKLAPPFGYCTIRHPSPAAVAQLRQQFPAAPPPAAVPGSGRRT
jgi:peptide/nickel transport system permease protein